METVKVNDGTKVKEIVRMRCTRGRGGVCIEMQSGEDFSFLYQKESRGFTLGGIECYLPRQGDGSNLPGVPGVFYTNANTLFNDSGVNLSLILAKNLKKGVKFNFGEFPISVDKMGEIAQQLKNQLKILWLSYCKEDSIEVRITAETIEKKCIIDFRLKN